MTTYLGIEVLTMPPNRELQADEPQKVEQLVMDPETGLRKTTTLSPAPARARALPMLAMDLGEAYELRKFIRARRGRQKAFWVSSWQRDLMLASAELATSSTITVRECGYATRMWPASPARRHLVLLAPGSATQLFRKVTAAVSNGDGTETLTLEDDAGGTQHGVAIATTWLVSFLRYVRLDADEIEFRWNGRVASVSLPTVELPAEVPA